MGGLGVDRSDRMRSAANSVLSRGILRETFDRFRASRGGRLPPVFNKLEIA
jgi:hypothetical protein